MEGLNTRHACLHPDALLRRHVAGTCRGKAYLSHFSRRLLREWDGEELREAILSDLQGRERAGGGLGRWFGDTSNHCTASAKRSS